MAWAQVLAQVSGREDVVFGTVLFGRMQGGEGADRVMGLFINTLPVRIAVGEEGVEASVRGTHAQLAELLRHEHASLALAQRCSGVPAPTPLFSALLNYRHSGSADRARRKTSRRAWEGIEGLRGEERTQLSAHSFGRRPGSRLWTDGAECRRRLGRCGSASSCSTALESLVEALETTPAMPVRSARRAAGGGARAAARWMERTAAAYPERAVRARAVRRAGGADAGCGRGGVRGRRS